MCNVLDPCYTYASFLLFIRMLFHVINELGSLVTAVAGMRDFSRCFSIESLIHTSGVLDLRPCIFPKALFPGI